MVRSAKLLPVYSALVESERDLCRRDLLSHIEIACRKQFDPVVHYDIIEAFQRGDWYEAIIMLPRGHFKSTLIACYLTWRIAQNRNFTCLVVGAVAKTAAESVGFVKVILESKSCQEIYGKFEGDSIWNTAELVVLGRTEEDADRSPTIKSMGMESFKPGGHFDVVWFDDVEDNDSVNTPDLIFKTRKNDTFALPMADKPGSKRITSGTFYADNDLYCHKIEKFGLGAVDETTGQLICPNGARSTNRRRARVAFFKPAWDENEAPLFPSRFSLEDLKELQAEMEFTIPGSFDKQYLLNPVTNKSARFRPEDHLTVDTPPNGPLEVAFGLDFAQSKSEGSDRTGIVGFFHTPDYNFYVFEASELAIQAEAQQQAIFDRHLAFPNARFYAEADNFVKGWLPQFEAECRRRGIFPIVEWIDAGARTKKDDRIFGTEGLFRAKRIHFLPGTHILWSQLSRMPASRRKDVADAFTNPMPFIVPTFQKEGSGQNVPLRGWQKLLQNGAGDPPWGKSTNVDTPYANKTGDSVPWEAA